MADPAPHVEDAVPLARVAADASVPERTARRWRTRYRAEGLVSLARPARGRTNAQIAAELHISIRTVGSHLDRIRDKTGCRRRTDLTRLALSARLV